jgi:peptide/nickel transport system substrate-binding protein
MPVHNAARAVSRRGFLAGSAALAVSSLLAACGNGSTATDTPKAAAPTTAPPTSAAASGGMTTGTPNAAQTTAKPATQPKGELKLALGFDFPAKIDALKDTHLSPYGMLETLTRPTPQNKLEPWLAQSVTNVNPTTWRIALRPNAKFWDGSPVTADDVIAAFKKNWDAFPDTKGLISPEAKMTAVDAKTVEFITPQPSAIFPFALSLTSFGIHKPSTPGGTDGALMTGPYKATKLVVDNELDLEPFADHWNGPPPLAKITMRFVGDPNARVLALQSGDVDMLYNFPPEAIKTFGPDIDASATPSGRCGLINLNVNRPPFNDRAVREAFALGIDRTVLNTIGLDGKGTPLTTMFPPISGYYVIPLQGTDVNRAKQLLDDAGWKPGPDGVRGKGTDRLAFTLLSYPGRADLTPYAVSIQSQLKPLGFAVEVKEVQNIGDATKGGNFDAAIKSNNTLPTANPLYEYNRLIAKGGGDNAGGYVNPQIEDLLAQMRVELDPAKATALSKQVQEIVKQDVPVIFLTVTPITTALRKGKIKGYTPHPNDSYLITTDMSVS